ncbi:UPF0158 family protein [Paeniglutamicibacter antarcticus]
MMLKLEDLDLDMIASVMQDDGSMGAEYYLDLDTGDVVLPGFSDDLEIQDIQEGNYVWIDRIESYESYRHMEDFTHALPEGQARMKLEQALIRSKPFRHFKETLNSFPDQRKAWFDFKDEAMREVIVRWLVSVEAIEDPDPDSESENLQE